MSKISNVKLEDFSEDPVRHIQDWFDRLGKLSANKDLHGLKLLIEKFPEWILEVDEGGWDSLFIVSALGFTDGVSLFIHHGADVNRKAADGSTSFHAAVGPGHIGSALKIMDAGGDPTLQDKIGLSPMMMVCDKGAADLFKIIFDKYPQSIMGEDKEGRGCYAYANEKGHLEITSIISDDRMRKVLPKHIPERVVTRV